MTIKNIFTIPAGWDFTKILAQKLMQETVGQPEHLSSYLIILPTRRACRILQETFIDLNKHEPLLLPRMNPLGDIEEEELSLSIAAHENAQDFMDIPSEISPLRRQLLLARLITKLGGHTRNFDQALALAEALGRLLDQIYIENLDFSKLEKLVPEEFANHWQITTQFLKILSEYWPLILQENNAIDAADRRNRLIRALKNHWQKKPPTYPVIAAGSTGSIPATAELLDVISTLPQGRIVLPGLDAGMDDESWNALEVSHPQAPLKNLLEKMNVSRHDVRLWEASERDALMPRHLLAREIMRPASTTQSWTDITTSKKAKILIEKGIKGVSTIIAANEIEEARSIALLFRETLETPGQNAVLITPDRLLAKRVIAHCRAWNITVDDSAGAPFDQTILGSFFRLITKARLSHLAPVTLLSLLKHPYFNASLEEKEKKESVEFLDNALRGLKPQPGLAGLYERADADNPVLRNIAAHFEKDLPARADFSSWLNWHLETAENLAATSADWGADILWRNEEGEAAAKFFAGLRDEAGLFPEMNLQEYDAILTRLMHMLVVRPPYGTHPRLKILGQLESRLVQADLVILGGLNEGTWPADVGYDPWMSRPMRQEFGLPPVDRTIALAAHDFMQGFCNPQTVLTRSLRRDGTPTVPARWLQRLETVREAAGLTNKNLTSPALYWAKYMNDVDDFTPASRPAPCPPIAARPRHLSVTRIETWLKDPYSIYARHVLDLKKLKPLEHALDNAERGNLLHAVLNDFITAYPVTLPDDAAAILIRLGRDALEQYHEDPASWNFWLPRFENLSEKFIELETDWRKKAKNIAREANGRLVITSEKSIFTLTAHADRIDSIADGAAIIDYKSGGTFTKSSMESGEHVQLPLEALMLQEGSFATLGCMKTTSLSYWKLTGGTTAGEIIELDKNLEALIERTSLGLRALIDAFDDPLIPYINLPHADNVPRFNDYKHLARVREWSAFGDDDDASGEAA